MIKETQSPNFIDTEKLAGTLALVAILAISVAVAVAGSLIGAGMAIYSITQLLTGG